MSVNHSKEASRTIARRNVSASVAIFNLMEDAATAEISRAQLWLWHRRGVVLEGGTTFTRDLYLRRKAEELSLVEQAMPAARWKEASALLDELVLAEHFAEFLTLGAYERLA
jgi:malate synthase